jgi:hypothetical protein
MTCVYFATKSCFLSCLLFRVIRRICATQYLLTVHLNVRQTLRREIAQTERRYQPGAHAAHEVIKIYLYDFKTRKINIPPSYHVCRSTRRFFYETKFDTSTLTVYYLHKNNSTCACTLRNVCTLKRKLAPFIPTEI